MKKKWSKLDKGDEVVIDGLVYVVKKISGGKALVVNANEGMLRVDASGKVEVPTPETNEERTAREKIEAKLNRRIKEKAADARTMRANVKAKAERERVQAAWTKPVDKAEKVVERELGATLVGVQGGKGEPYVCPVLDPSTIKAHLLVFHEYDAEDRSYAALHEMHEWAHRPENADAIPTPHTHAPSRPV